MGTRHLIAIVKDGDFKLAQYGQWDGYPGGQGATVLGFLRDTENVEALRANVDKLRFVTDADWPEVYRAIGADPENEYLDGDQHAKFTEMYPSLSRDTGAGVLAKIAAGEIELTRDEREFANDSLFCEWAYVIDLDANVLEVYRGFQDKPHQKGRFARRKPRNWKPDFLGQMYYYPVALQASYPFDALPEQDAFEWEMMSPEERKEFEDQQREEAGV